MSLDINAIKARGADRADLPVLIAEIERLRSECVEYDKANTDLGRALTDARAELERAKPVLEAAEVAVLEIRSLRVALSDKARALVAAVDEHAAVCTHCGGRDDTHTVRNCAAEGLSSTDTGGAS